jgi:type I restriction enzyme S subunit
VDQRKINPRFFLYNYISPHYQEFLNTRIVHGATVNRILLKDFPYFPFPCPPLDEQKAIVSLLGALDDKIELNRQTNETLEALARALFKDWFVDFGPTRTKAEGGAPYLAPELWELFPDALDDEDKPMGWEVRPLDKIARFLNGLALQKYPASGNDYLPVIKIAELRSGITEKSGKASIDLPSDYVVKDGDVLFSWSGSLVQLVWTGGNGALNQHLFKVTSDEFPKWFHFYWVEQHLPDFRAIAASKATTMGHIQRRHLSESETIVPDKKLLGAADAMIGPIFRKRIDNDLESRTLAQTRDLLRLSGISVEYNI